MTQFFTSSNIMQGRGAAESPGSGVALGDTLIINGANTGGDLVPSIGGIVGGVNHKSCGVFADEADGDSEKQQPAAFLATLVRMQTGASRTVINRAGLSPIVLPQCCAGLPNAAGTFLAAPSDIGAGAGQINPDSDLWNISQLEQYPSVFVRSSMNVRALLSQLDGDTGAEDITGADGVEVFTVDEKPTYSLWVVDIDGQSQTILTPHPASVGDIRRARDAWSEVLVPLIQQANSNSAPFPLWRDAGAGTLLNRGYVTRLSYIQYARHAGFGPDVRLTPVRRGPS